MVSVYDYDNCWQCLTKHFKVMYTTGPAIVNNVLQKTNTKCMGLGKELNSCDPCGPRPCKCKDCYIIDLQGERWNSLDSKLINGMLCYWRYIITIFIIIAIVVLYFKIF